MYGKDWLNDSYLSDKKTHIWTEIFHFNVLRQGIFPQIYRNADAFH